MDKKFEKGASLSNFFEKKITDMDTESNNSVISIHADPLLAPPVEYFTKVDTLVSRTHKLYMA